MIELSMPELKRIESVVRNNEGYLSFAQGALRLRGGIDASIKEYAQQILQTDKADYYQDALGILPLRKKIAEMLASEYQSPIGIDNVMITHGGSGALTCLALTLLSAGDEVILLEPSYPVYESIVKFSKAVPVFVPAFEMKKIQGEQQWVLDVSVIEQAITPHTKMLILSNPSNPCGTVLSREELEQLRRIAELHNIYLVVDEVYDDFIFEGQFYSSTPLIPQSDRVLRVGSFSKSLGMSGWRVGFLVAPFRLIKSISVMQGCAFNCPSVIGQYAALYGLEHKNDIIPRSFDQVKKSRDLACAFFDLLQEQGIVSYVKPTAGFYLFFKTQQEDSFELVMNILQEAKIAMAPGCDFGQTAKPFVRFCYARDPEVVVEGIKRLQDYFIRKNISQSVQMMSNSL
ncbi:pyridoxal phosphate-dependent aminotransferase [Candidatus Babeliales bacterium]|nr:pyridoxal phosphate-dependent aminotransferase [Candidatus Babeliales bacterium]MBY0353926.1 pyridoxal phosphate-dependent aminotransferase [Candidatus Babeliales bacterium]